MFLKKESIDSKFRKKYEEYSNIDFDKLDIKLEANGSNQFS